MNTLDDEVESFPPHEHSGGPCILIIKDSGSLFTIIDERRLQ